MFFALSNLVTGQPPAWRQLSGPGDQLNPGEVLYQGVPPQNAVWDATLNNGQGSLRSATPTELIALVAPEVNAMTALQTYASSNPTSPEGQAIIALLTILGIAKPAPASPASTTTTTPSAPTPG